MFSTNLSKLVEKTQSYLTCIDSPLINEVIAHWSSHKSGERSVKPNTISVISLLPSACSVTTTKSSRLVQAILSSNEVLKWGQTYTNDEVSSYFLRNYGWAELIGERGPIPNRQIACGFLLLGPHIEYPRHAHQAKEIYVPLTHLSYWKWDKEKWEKRPPDRPIYHSSWMPHAIQTSVDPLVALYLWWDGNLAQKSIFSSRAM